MLEALSFLVEVDAMIHASMLGEGFERHVTDQCDVLRVFSEIRGTWQPYAVVVFAGLLVTICPRFATEMRGMHPPMYIHLSEKLLGH